MATEVSLCSNALVILGAAPISSLLEDNDRARAASNLYPGTRDAMIRSHPWNSCIKRVVLSPNVDLPAFGYAYAYLLPGDWIRTLDVDSGDFPADFKAEGRNLLCDESSISLRYVFNNKDPASWDAMLVEGMTLAMVAKLAYAITKSLPAQAQAQAALQQFLKQARAVDGQDDPPQTLGDFPLYRARR